jgi:hypothetical protein
MRGFIMMLNKFKNIIKKTLGKNIRRVDEK